MIGPETWGPAYWTTMLAASIHYTPQDGGDAWERGMELLTGKLLPCKSCETNAVEIVKQFPPADYKSTPQRRLEWVEKVRREVKKHEAKKPPGAWLRKNKARIGYAVIGLLLLGAAFAAGFFIQRRMLLKPSAD